MGNLGKKFHPETLTTAEAESLMAACSPTSATGKRNRALIIVLWRGALRCEEALKLQVHDLDRRSGSVRVMFGKGRRARTVWIEPRGLAVIEQWLAARREKGIPRTAPLFCTMRGGPLSDSYVRWMVREMGRRAGIGKRVHPHGLRHTRAAEMSDEGKSLLAISLALGHSNVGTTDRYINHLHPRQVKDAMLNSEWGRTANDP